jgi:uncharacterized membrane protein HdeD (DUF308 family)
MDVQGETYERRWMYVIAGIIAILFGIAVVMWPGRTLPVLVILFGVYAILIGVVSLFDMIHLIGTHQTWWPALIMGVIDIAVGVFVLAYPGVSTVVLLWAIAFWAIFIGVIEVISSFSTGQFLLLILGALTIVFGFVLLANPAAGALTLVYVIGFYAIIRGIILLYEAFRPPTAPAYPV